MILKLTYDNHQQLTNLNVKRKYFKNDTTLIFNTHVVLLFY